MQRILNETIQVDEQKEMNKDDVECYLLIDQAAGFFQRLGKPYVRTFILSCSFLLPI